MDKQTTVKRALARQSYLKRFSGATIAKLGALARAYRDRIVTHNKQEDSRRVAELRDALNKTK